MLNSNCRMMKLKPMRCSRLRGRTHEDSKVYSDSWQGFDELSRDQAQVNHNQGEWARGDDGNGEREVHTNTIEGAWTELRTRLHPFRGVSKHYLSGYIAL